MSIDLLNILAEWIVVILFNGVWGGLLIVALLWFGVKIASRITAVNASTRYVVWITGIIICTSVMVWQGLRSMPAPFTTKIDTLYVNFSDSELAQAEPTTVQFAPEGVFSDWVEPEVNQSVNQSEQFATANSTFRISKSDTITIETAEQPLILRVEKDNWIAQILPAVTNKLSVKTPPLWFSYVLLVIWILISAILLCRLSLSGVFVQRLKKEAGIAPEPIEQASRHWLKMIRGIRPVEVGISHAVRSAVAVGYIHPMVLLPQKMVTALDQQDLEQVILHELVHIRRFDDWTILIQQLAKCFLFFHPGIWMLSRWMNEDREIACDDRVVSISRKPKMYASCLAKVAALHIPGYVPLSVAPAISTKKQLFIRVKSILNTSLSSSYRMSRTVFAMMLLFTITVLVAIINIAPVIAFAEEKVENLEAIENILSEETVPVGTEQTAHMAPMMHDAVTVEGHHPEPIVVPNETNDEPTLSVARSIDPAPLDQRAVSQVQVAPLYAEESVAPILELPNVPLAPISPVTETREDFATANQQANPLSKRSMIRLLEAVKSIPSSHEQKILLDKVARQMQNNDEVHVAFIDAAMSVTSYSERMRILHLFLDRSELSKEGAIYFLDAVRSLPSSENRHILLQGFLSIDAREWIKDGRVDEVFRLGLKSLDNHEHYVKVAESYLTIEKKLNENK